MAVEYPQREVLACRMAMIEVFTILGEYRDRIALVGGWVPPLLAPENAKLHTGSLDIDLAADTNRIGDDAYRTIRDTLIRQGYEQGDQPFRFFRSVLQACRIIVFATLFLSAASVLRPLGSWRLSSSAAPGDPRIGFGSELNLCPSVFICGSIRFGCGRRGRAGMIEGSEPVKVAVDFLAGEYGGTGNSHRTQPVQDLRARKARGCDLVFDHPVAVRIAGAMRDGAQNEVSIKIAGPVPFLVMKGMALWDRMNEKDAHDIYWLVRYYPGGIGTGLGGFTPVPERLDAPRSWS